MTRSPFSLLIAAVLAFTLLGCGEPERPDPPDGPEAGQATYTPAEAKRFFDAKGKTVLTFVGYSGAGYEDEARLEAEARKILEGHDPAKTIVNIGATPDGIGAVYELAKDMGFETSGVVSTRAKEAGAAPSPHVDHLLYVVDETWGGLVEGTGQLSPTSEAMVSVSDVLVGIGGGAVGRDELEAAKARGKPVTFIPADMNHAKAIEKARKKGKPVPTDFQGAAHGTLGK